MTGSLRTPPASQGRRLTRHAGSVFRPVLPVPSRGGGPWVAGEGASVGTPRGPPCSNRPPRPRTQLLGREGSRVPAGRQGPNRRSPSPFGRLVPAAFPLAPPFSPSAPPPPPDSPLNFLAPPLLPRKRRCEPTGLHVSATRVRAPPGCREPGGQSPTARG